MVATPPQMLVRMDTVETVPTRGLAMTDTDAVADATASADADIDAQDNAGATSYGFQTTVQMHM